jgi:hypothetical protein
MLAGFVRPSLPGLLIASEHTVCRLFGPCKKSESSERNAEEPGFYKKSDRCRPSKTLKKPKERISLRAYAFRHMLYSRVCVGQVNASLDLMLK